MVHKIKENIRKENNSEKKAFVVFFQKNDSATSVQVN